MNELISYLRLRAHMYRVLAAPFYKESTPAYLKELQKCIPVFRELGSGDLKQAADGLERYFSENTVTEQLIDAHERIFARLFLCVVPEQSSLRSICPQESPYLSPSGLIMQEPRDRIIDLMSREKAGLDKSFNEPEDHICAEFHFMSMLSQRLAELLDGNCDNTAAENNLAVQCELMEEHIIKWVPVMCGDLVNESGNLSDRPTAQYFTEIAGLVTAFVKYDAVWLSELKDAKP